MRDNVVLVAVDQASFHFDKLYSYRLPPSAGEVTRGCRVLVPFGGGNRQRQGIVVRTDTAEDTARLKPIAQVLEREPLLDGEMMDLALWLKERTFCTVFDAVRAMLPTGLYMRLRPMLRLAPKAKDRLLSGQMPGRRCGTGDAAQKAGAEPGRARPAPAARMGDRAAVGGRFPPGGGRLHPHGAPGPGGGGAGRGAERLHR